MPRKIKRAAKRTNAKKAVGVGTVRFVGRMVGELRQKCGLTQEQLAAQCQVRGLNLSRSGLAKVEAGIRHVMACELVVIAKVLKVRVEEFFPVGFGERRPTRN